MSRHKKYMNLRRKAILAVVIAAFLVSAIAFGFYIGAAYQRGIFRSKSLSITAYLHQIDACAARFFSEFPDRDRVSYAELVDQMKYMPRKQPVLGEDYDALFISRDVDHISVIIPGTYLSVTRRIGYIR